MKKISAILAYLKSRYRIVKENPRMITTIIKELYHTFKKPIQIGILLGIGLLILIPLVTYLFFVRDLSSKENILSRKSAGVILLDRNEKPFFTFYQAKQQNTVPITKITKDMQEAVISAEDRDFYNHRGFSVSGFGRAFLTNIREDEVSQGGSTITQQLVKNTLLSQDKSYLRKYQELFLAIEVDRRFSKEDILEMYLNTSYFGEGAYGVEDAAKTYFSKKASELSLAESALLTAVLPAPSALSPLTGNRDRAFERQKLILKLMEQEGFITNEERIEAESEEVAFNPTSEDQNVKAPHFALMVKDELIKKYGEQRVARSGYTVKTTIDLEDQEFAETAVANQVARLSRNKVTNAATVGIDPQTGEILVLVGSHDWFNEENGKINMVIRPRQPGSSFKPLVYAAALEDRSITAATQLEDKPITYPDGYKPKNYDGKFRNEVLVRFALANSLNIPVLHVLEKIGIPEVINFAEKMGITTLKNPDDYGLSFALGAAEVPLIEMASAFGAFANEGNLIKPTTILDIKDKRGNVIFSHVPSEDQAVSHEVAFLISSILSDNAARADVFGGSLTLSRQAAVKTGTTEDYRDALTVGYTPSLVVGVWVGNNDNSPMDSIAGSSGAAPIWRTIMERMLAGTPVERFRQPTGVLTTQVCRENGLRAEVATSSAYSEFFLPGTLPRRTCTEGSPTPFVTETPTPTQSPENTPTPTPFVESPTPTPTSTPVPSTSPEVTIIPLP